MNFGTGNLEGLNRRKWEGGCSYPEYMFLKLVNYHDQEDQVDYVDTWKRKWQQQP